MELFDRRAHDFIFYGKVVDVYDCADKTNVILDHTQFYPGKRGQPHPKDRGYLNKTRVMDVIRQDGRIVHMMDRKLDLSIGDQVTGAIELDARLRYMQHHTAEHLLLSRLFSRYTITPLAWHYHFGKSSIDVCCKTLTDAMLNHIERDVNALIRANLPVTIYEERLHADPPIRLPIDNPPRLGDFVRVVEIGDVDRAVCDGLHCETTGRIDCISLNDFEPLGVGHWNISYSAGGAVNPGDSFGDLSC
ncbi:MAG: alanyl-tRNA editing protein [Chloroflexota bacterium]|nr:alanyl-tRNA editing protein [Chloroflexota bacterium]